MPAPPDQFQRRIHVRLPFADALLAGGERARAVEAAMRESFRKPLLQVTIARDGAQALQTRGEVPGAGHRAS